MGNPRMSQPTKQVGQRHAGILEFKPMEIEVGQMIKHRNGLMAGIIVNHWKMVNPYDAGMVDCICIFMTYDHSHPIKLNETITFRDFHLYPYWKVIN